MQRHAYHEAIEHLGSALTLLRAQPETSGRTSDELELTLALAPLLQYTRGYGAPETEDAYRRARELSQRVDDRTRQFITQLRLAYYLLVRSRLGEAREAATQCLAIAETLEDPQRLADAHHALGCMLFWLGGLDGAREHLEQCVAVLDPRQHRWTPFGSGMFAPGTLAVGQLGWTLWLLGYPDRGVETVHRSVTLARELGYPLNIGSTLAFTATVHQQRREVDATAEYVDAQLALAAREGYPHWVVDGGFKRAWVLAERGEQADALQ
jgi:tetratricopeptide (TPR) repeat protein